MNNIQGLSSEEVKTSRIKYGSNVLTELPKETLARKFLNNLSDPMIIILLCALVIQLVLFFMGRAEWFEPFGIFVAVVIAGGVSSITEYQQEQKASFLKSQQEAGETTKVIRDGSIHEIHVSEVVTGDVIFLQAGDKIPADGVLIDGAIKVDQSALNGETEEAEKIPNDSDEKFDVKDLLNKYYAYRGTVVCSGEGYEKISVVGDKTLFGELALEVQEAQRKTPLQVKLGKLAKQISVFGYIGAIAIVLGILLRTLITGNLPSDFYAWARLLIDAVTVAVTIVVCAVPEGLPMLTSMLMSFQSMQMAGDNVLVRKINGLETAGSLNLLFTDKTGTITEGRLTIAEIAMPDAKVFTELKGLDNETLNDLIIGAGVNNSATVGDGNVIGGNSTDRALMSFFKDNPSILKIISKAKNDVKKFTAFNSDNKMSTVEFNDGSVYVKGAPEKILVQCKNIPDRKKLDDYINAQADRAMRLLAIAKEAENKMELICVLSIRDNVRKEAVDAIKQVRSAGIQVVMVTGDRKETAVAIAKEAGLISSPDEIAMTSQEMAAKSDEELKKILPDLRVISRALPSDKSRLVKIAQELNLVVGMTGDGVNDSPALKKADVGFAMGSGTEVAKEAGDITILDDNFKSIAKAILYGRSMFKSIRKFLVFQLTVNVAAVVTCFLGPLFGQNIMLTVIQLLLINLAMDTLAAIAFGSEPPREQYMNEKPIPRDENIITPSMFNDILIGAAYVTLICMAVMFFGPVKKLFMTDDIIYLRTALFAVFMMSITFNGLSMASSKNCVLVMLFIFVLQWVFVEFGGEVLSVKALSLDSWLNCFVLAVLIVPVKMGIEFLIKKYYRK
ncbi:MAG: calcium-translocating P-type ATPase, PMCA-type [Synergistales bacterium]|nr:calcium-translocating P-type ATPase, PMCA-type [Synergistales bacterium]MDY6402301.1 calcium-translocating P-type ATPase, PMCA-type [Synergistales bacterium]MDY6405494.1 calcium-translocating P-type ATPase, PMCA-type [Synergistales bacterium]MDY6409848.1 calcium-translocating P-type ATPase, PMCA-type [Synergistales bacterium]MDY6414442.1 calcium-translocating P-type ATPase, PMCA-type [Synergistales bacterium]